MKGRIGIGRFAPLAVAVALATAACASRTAAPPTPSVESEEGGSTTTSRSSASLRALERLAAERGKQGALRSYRIGPGDLVEIVVFDLKEMNRRVRVSQSGDVPLPLIGKVPAAGKTEAELGREIADRLSREYLQNPQVDVFIAEYRSELVAVTGSVGKPGLYPLNRDRNTILDMLSEAGGLTKGAGAFIDFMPARSAAAKQAMRRARDGKVRTPVDGGTGGISIDLAELMRGANRTLLQLPVIPGDVIFVPQSGMFSVEGWVDKPGTYPLTRGMTVLSAVSAGGGELFPAELSRIELFREETMGARESTVQVVDLGAVRRGEGSDVVLRAGDVVHVPANPVRLAPYSVYWAIKNFIYLGVGASTGVAAP